MENYRTWKISSQLPVASSQFFAAAFVCRSISFASSCCGLRSSRHGAIQTYHDQQKSSEDQNRGGSRQPQNVDDDGSVFSSGRIVVVTVEKHLIDGVADFSLRGLDQSHAQIFWRKIHAVEVA